MWPIKNDGNLLLFLWGPFGQYPLWLQDKTYFETNQTGSRLAIMQILICYRDVRLVKISTPYGL